MGGSGDTGGGSGKNPGHRDDVFVSDDTTTGSLRLEVEQQELPIGETTGFRVFATNADGQPVPSISVACDTEKGLALIEPSTGYELTDDQGQMSGRIGCERPGSFQMVCRLTVGANRRKFVGVRCTGDLPSGFVGFPGAGGGGLGGGVQVGDSGDVNIVAMGFEDGGTLTSGSEPSANASIDILQTADCDGVATTFDPEPFYDTYVNLQVENKLAEDVRFTSLTYSLKDVDSQGTDFTSKRIGLTRNSNSTVGSDGGTSSIIVPIFKAAGGGKFVGDPTGVGIQITQIGLRTVTVTLSGVTATGKPIEVMARATAAFGTYNRCSN
jgi:hypothetical protein